MSVFLLDFFNLHIMFIKKSAIFKPLKKESINIFEIKKTLKRKAFENFGDLKNRERKDDAKLEPCTAVKALCSTHLSRQLLVPNHSYITI